MAACNGSAGQAARAECFRAQPPVLCSRSHLCNELACAAPPPLAQGPVVSLSSYIPDAEDTPSESSSTVAGTPAEEFPPLPGAAPSAAAAAAGPAAAGISGSSGSQAAGGPAPAAGDNPLLAAFAAERQLMEQLRDDVQAKLASFKVCVCLCGGREGCAEGLTGSGSWCPLAGAASRPCCPRTASPHTSASMPHCNA